ncbi:COP9 signalosome complex subunit 1 [Thoreauomyces humboldtii]|nr:COP9 signalosome complex subunit 1 [Thoreauomyces humboldtii]
MNMDIDHFPPDEQGTATPGRRPAEDDDTEKAEDNIENKKKKIVNVIVNEPTLELDTYIGNYSGHTKVDRLVFIAERCPPLSIEAYRLALVEIRTDLNVGQYGKVLGKLNAALRDRNQLVEPVDEKWVSDSKHIYKERLERLERELKEYKVNLIKESIRMGHNDLGDHHYNAGELDQALKCYMRTKDYCTFAKHVIEMNFNVAQVCLEMNNFAHVTTYITKAENTPEAVDPKHLTASKLKCMSGLVNLEGGKYKRAALDFLQVSFALGSEFSRVIAPNDVAIYGGLCALATFDRVELKAKVFDNTEFRQYLELEPQIRELLQGFYHSKYSLCLEVLAKLKNDFHLDIWLHGHVDELYRKIRRKALVQYFHPFLAVDLKRMARAFGTSVTELEEELRVLIVAKEINARIDSHSKASRLSSTSLFPKQFQTLIAALQILRLQNADQRSIIFERSLAMGIDYQIQLRHTLLRMKLVRSDLLVKESTNDRSRRNIMFPSSGSIAASGSSRSDPRPDSKDPMIVDA